MIICTAALSVDLEVPPMRLIKPRAGHTRVVTTRVRAESMWVTFCVLIGGVAQVAHNLLLTS